MRLSSSPADTVTRITCARADITRHSRISAAGNRPNIRHGTVTTGRRHGGRPDEEVIHAFDSPPGDPGSSPLAPFATGSPYQSALSRLTAQGPFAESGHSAQFADTTMPEDRDVRSVLAAMRELRSEFNARMDELEARLQGPQCSVCGHSVFKEGPKGRKSKNGTLPACAQCGSLERHRIVRAVWNAFVGEQFPPHEGASVQLRPVGGQKVVRIPGGVDLQETKLSEFGENRSRVGKLSCRHLQPCARAREGRPASVSGDHANTRAYGSLPVHRAQSTQDVPSPTTGDIPSPTGHHHYRVYGKDLVHRFGEASFECEIPGDLQVPTTLLEFPTLVYFASLDGQQTGFDSTKRQHGFSDRDAMNQLLAVARRRRRLRHRPP